MLRLAAGLVSGSTGVQTPGLPRGSKAKKDVSNTRKFVASISRHAVRPELVSMMACFSCDKGFRVDDFKNFKVAEWLCKATELKSTSGLEPHYVHIAKALREKD